MQTKEEGQIIIARLFTDEDILTSLKEIGIKYEITTAVVLSAIGQIKKFTLGFFNGQEYINRYFEDTHELLSVSGMLSFSGLKNEYQMHLHAIAGDTLMLTCGGHLVSGIAETTVEIVLMKTGIKAERIIDPESGLSSLLLE